MFGINRPSRPLPAQGEVEVEGLGLEEGRHEAFQQLLVKHAVDTAAVHALAQQRAQSFPRDLPDRQKWRRKNKGPAQVECYSWRVEVGFSASTRKLRTDIVTMPTMKMPQYTAVAAACVMLDIVLAAAMMMMFSHLLVSLKSSLWAIPGILYWVEASQHNRILSQRSSRELKGLSYLLRTDVLRPVRRALHPTVDRLKCARGVCLAELVSGIGHGIKRKTDTRYVALRLSCVRRRAEIRNERRWQARQACRTGAHVMRMMAQMMRMMAHTMRIMTFP